jgi:hypothetical protein
MRKRNKKDGIAILLIAAAVLVLAGCPQEAEELSSNAEVESIIVAGKTVILGTPGMDWMEVKEPGNSGSVFLSAAQMPNAEVVVKKGQDGQKVYLAAAKPSVMPDFVDDKTTFAFDVLDYLWVEVFSENHDDYKLYAIQIRTSTPVVTDVTLGDRSPVGGILPNGRPIQQYGTGLGNYNVNLAQATEGEIWFGDTEVGTALAVAVTPEDPDTTVLVAGGAANATADALFPTGYVSPSTITVTDGSYLYIKSISADTVNGETVYYKLKLVQKYTSFTIGNVTIQGNQGSSVPFAVGTAGSNGFGGGENRGQAAELAANNAGYLNILSTVGATSVNATVDIGTKPQGATFRYGHTDWNAAQEDVESAGHTTLVYQAGNVLQGLPNNEFIAVEVTNGLGDKRWYSFRIRVGGPNADLTALTVSTGNTVGTIPAPNAAATGTTAGSHTMSAAGPWTLNLQSTVSPGATVAYATTATAAANVTTWNTDGTFTGIATAQYVNVRVISGDAFTTQYYKVRLVYGSSDADLISLDVLSGSEPVYVVPAANDTVTGIIAADYHMVTAAGPWDLDVNAVVSTGATVTYATAATATANVTTWNATGIFEGISSAQYVYVRVTPEDLTEPSYYKVRLLYGSDDADILTVTVGGESSNILPATAGTVNPGTPQTTDTKGNVTPAVPPSFTGNPGSVDLTAAVAGAEFTVVATVSVDATVRYGYVADVTAGGATTRSIQWTTGNIPAISVTAVLSNYVIVEVTSESGIAKQYVIQVTILP